jgi:hypothetical protein
MATCVYDNPCTYHREAWQDGVLIASISSELMATTGFNGHPDIFFGLNIGEKWFPGNFYGDPAAVPDKWKKALPGMKKPHECKHMNFDAHVAVARLEDIGKFNAEISIKCLECGTPMQFLGLAPGLKLTGAAVSVDGLEARLAICPQGAQPSPLQEMTLGTNQLN